MDHMIKEQMIEKMIVFCQGNTHDISHFLKVLSFASLIGRMESLDETDLNTLEYAAIVHDIACPLCRLKYGHTKGGYQEWESEPLLRLFLEEFPISESVKERVIYLVSHHHTYHPVDGIDHQILLEADFLVNAGES